MKDYLGLRIAPKLKKQLKAAALANTRSLSQEVEIRLIKSFERENTLHELLNKKWSARENGEQA